MSKPLKITNHDQWCDLDGEGQCDCGVDKINERIADIVAVADENVEVIKRLEQQIADLSEKLASNMCGYCDRKMHDEVYVSDLQQQIATANERIRELEQDNVYIREKCREIMDMNDELRMRNNL